MYDVRLVQCLNDCSTARLGMRKKSSYDLEVSMNTYETCWSLDAHGIPENVAGFSPDAI